MMIIWDDYNREIVIFVHIITFLMQLIQNKYSEAAIHIAHKGVLVGI